MTTERKPPARPKPSTERGYATKIDKPRRNRPAARAASGAEVDEDALTNIHGGLPTTVDPRQPASGDPHARVGPRSAPGGSPIAQEVLARVPAPPPIPATSSGPRPAARFDPHARIDDSSRTAKWDPGEGEGGPRHPRPDSEPLRVVSMKTPHRELPEKMQRELPVQKLRALSDLHKTPPQGLGRLAPPLDPRQARTRKWGDYVIWGSLAIVVACVVTLVIWFAAR